MRPLVVELETTRAGLILTVKDEVVRVVGFTIAGAGGLVDVFRTTSCGLASVICNWL
jgi:hypothetical protein